jgi:large subunit ribosomal protein L47
MLSLSRYASKQIPAPLLRSFAQVVGRNVQDPNPNLDASELDISHRRQRRQRAKKLGPTTPKTPSASSSTSTRKVAVREDHGLYAFFRKIPQKPDSPELVGEDRYEVVETPEEGQLITGLLFLARLIFYLADEGSQAELGRQRNCGTRVSRTFIPYGT